MAAVLLGVKVAVGLMLLMGDFPGCLGSQRGAQEATGGGVQARGAAGGGCLVVMVRVVKMWGG